jgi:hypothetical protein
VEKETGELTIDLYMISDGKLARNNTDSDIPYSYVSTLLILNLFYRNIVISFYVYNAILTYNLIKIFSFRLLSENVNVRFHVCTDSPRLLSSGI